MGGKAFSAPPPYTSRPGSRGLWVFYGPHGEITDIGTSDYKYKGATLPTLPSGVTVKIYKASGVWTVRTSSRKEITFQESSTPDITTLITQVLLVA